MLQSRLTVVLSQVRGVAVTRAVNLGWPVAGAPTSQVSQDWNSMLATGIPAKAVMAKVATVARVYGLLVI
jgi:hypothetical protein